MLISGDWCLKRKYAANRRKLSWNQLLNTPHAAGEYLRPYRSGTYTLYTNTPANRLFTPSFLSNQPIIVLREFVVRGPFQWSD